MVLKLSVTDQSPIHDGGPPSRGPHDSLRLAQACERFGYHRYWLAEHHNTPGYAGPCPEILVGHIAAHTRRIRVGSGGVMLPHYSPYKVAETFRMLEVLYPGRIDLGLGRAPGGDGMATAALAYPRQPINPDLYPRQVFDLMGYLNNDLPDQHPFHGIRLVPEGGGVPQFWMLGSSGGSAEVAGQLGCGFVLALFIGTHARSPAIVEAYRGAFQPSKSLAAPRALIAVAAVCAPTREEAYRIASTRSMWIHQALARGRIIDLPSPDEVDRLLSGMSAGERAQYQQVLDHSIVGTPDDCRQQIEAQAAEYGVDEVSIVTVTYRYADRERSYRLLAEAFGLAA
jgi:luciferase family oxidoreductase group 1